MATPVIVPVVTHSTSTMDCIVEAGKRYCEQSGISGRDLGIWFLILILWFGGVAFTLYKGFDTEETGWFIASGIIFIAPIILLILSN